MSAVNFKKTRSPSRKSLALQASAIAATSSSGAKNGSELRQSTSSAGPSISTIRSNKRSIVQHLRSIRRRRTSRRSNRSRSRPVISRRSRLEDRTKSTGSKYSLGFRLALLSGFWELSIGQTFLILLLWFPRFTFPWVEALHEFNVYVLSNPLDWKNYQADLFKLNIYIWTGKCSITFLCAVIADLIRRKWELDYYIYQTLLILFTLTPLAGGFVDEVLKDRFSDEHRYKNIWLSSIGVMKWIMSVAFIMFPVQFCCIYSQKTMSRKGVYSWTSVFLLIEFMSALIAFIAVPGPCPNREWTHAVAWTGMLLLLISVTMLTLVFLVYNETFKAIVHLAYLNLYWLGLCCRKREPASGATAVKQRFPGHIVDAPAGVKMKKLMGFSMIILSIIWSHFSLSFIERILPDDDWRDHSVLSSRGIFLFAKIVGVILMVSVMFVARYLAISPTRNVAFGRKPEMVYLGLPYILCILALISMVGRLASLSPVKEGDVLFGTIPDESKTVLVFVNTMFRNWTVCIKSEYFPPTKIRPYQAVTIELHDIAEHNITVSVEVDPCFGSSVKAYIPVHNIRKGEWQIFKISLRDKNSTNLDTWDYYRTLVWITLLDVGDVRPEVGAPKMLIFQWEVPVNDLDGHVPNFVAQFFYYEMNHSTSGLSVKVPLKTVWTVRSSSVRPEFRPYENARNLMLWEVPDVGTWTVRLWNEIYLKTADAYAWGSFCSPCAAPATIEVENNSLYLLVEYAYEEKTKEGKIYRGELSWLLPRFYSPSSPGSFSFYKLGEVASADSTRLPSNELLQEDWTVKLSFALAGMASGGIFLGFIYLFWVDSPSPRYRLTSLAVCWVLAGIAAEIPRTRVIDVQVKSYIVLLSVQVIVTGLYFVGAYFMASSIIDNIHS